MTRALLQQVLDVLLSSGAKTGYATEQAWDKVVADIQAELAKPEQSPFGYWHIAEDPDECEFHLAEDLPGNDCPACVALYTTPPTHTEAEVQEIMAADWNLSQDKQEKIVRRILGVPAP